MARVKVRATYDVLREFLRLPEDVTVIGPAFPSLAELLSTERPDSIVLILDMPDAPEGAVAVQPTYVKQVGQPDPVSIAGMWWYREDGSLIVPEGG